MSRPVDGPYILFVGTPEPRKNLERLVGRCLAAARRGPAERLVLAGADGWGDVRLPLEERVVQLGRVSDDTLRDLYAHASCVAYPSLWEGFGLVAGEALAAGCPVVCLGHPGAARGRGRRCRVLRSAARSRRSRTPCAARSTDRGRRRAATLTWESAARALADVWRELAG